MAGATNDKQFIKMVSLLGAPELADDPRFKTNGDRVNNREELFKKLNEQFATKTCDEWVKVFDGSGMPYAPINTMEKVFDHPQTEARDMVQEIALNSAKEGKIRILGMFPASVQDFY